MADGLIRPGETWKLRTTTDVGTANRRSAALPLDHQGRRALAAGEAAASVLPYLDVPASAAGEIAAGTRSAGRHE